LPWSIFACDAWGMVTVAARCDDGGMTWKQAETEVRFLANSISGLAIAFAPEGGQTNFFVSAVCDNIGYATSRFREGLFRSIDGELTSTRVALGTRWDSWNSCFGVHVAVGNPEVLAVVLVPKAGTGDRPLRGVPGVVLSREGGATWKLLDSGLSAGATTSILILHLMKDGCVLAIAEPADIVVWRKLTFWERFRGSYAVPL
jgi:hypothetical protein